VNRLERFIVERAERAVALAGRVRTDMRGASR
jgi:hypothetical protein